MKIAENKQQTVFCMTVEEREKKVCFPIRMFAVFFHPSTRVTALGGAEKRFAETVRLFSKLREANVTVLEPSPSFLDELRISCQKHLVSSSFRGKGWFGTYLEWGLWIAKALLKSSSVLRQEKPHVILVPNNTLPNLAMGYVIGRIFQRPVCAVVHHVDVPMIGKQTRDNSLYRGYRNVNYTKLVSLVKTLAFYVALPLLKRIDAIIAVSNFTANSLAQYGISKRKIRVSGNAIDLSFISKTKPLRTEIFDGVFVGRIAKEKGIFDLLTIWKNITERRKDAKLLIIGSGLELASLRRKITETKLGDNIVIKGRCSDTELYGLMKTSKVFIFPSIFEGWGIAVAEALACGLPVVAYDIPALREIFAPCQSVFLVPVSDTDKMTQTVSSLLSSGNKEFSDASITYAGRFEWERVARADLEAIGRVISGNLG